MNVERKTNGTKLAESKMTVCEQHQYMEKAVDDIRKDVTAIKEASIRIGEHVKYQKEAVSVFKAAFDKMFDEVDSVKTEVGVIKKDVEKNTEVSGLVMFAGKWITVIAIGGTLIGLMLASINKWLGAFKPDIL